MEEKRSFIKKGDIIIIGVIALAIMGYFGYSAYMKSIAIPQGNTAIITIGNEHELEINLGEYTDGKSQTISMEQYGVPVNFLLENESIRFVDVVCPDHLCEQFGAISADFDIAVCMPNQVAVTIRAPEEN